MPGPTPGPARDRCASAGSSTPGRSGACLPARTTLLQHFRGWFVRTERPVFDRDRAELMDFRVPQPRRRTRLRLCPADRRPPGARGVHRVLRRRPVPRGYEAALRHYTGQVTSASAAFEVIGDRAGRDPHDRRALPAAGRVLRCSASVRRAAPPARPPATPSPRSSGRHEQSPPRCAPAGTRCLPPPTRPARARWTRCCCEPWTPAGSTAPRSSRGCSAAPDGAAAALPGR